MFNFREEFGHMLVGYEAPSKVAFEFCAAVGSIVVVYSFFKSLFMLYGRIKRKAYSPTYYGKWAVVTGATDGIGKAYVMELANRGQHVLLISPTQSKLDQVAQEVEQQYPNVKTETLCLDFGKFGEEERQMVKDKFASLDDVALLVNNVGVSYPHPMFFHELEPERVEQLITLNLNSTVFMTHLALPFMLEQGKGAIVNIGSGAGTTPSPLLAEYCAAKAFLEKFSVSINREYQDKGIHVQVQMPYFVVSKLSKYKRPSFFVPSPETYVKKALGFLGHDSVISPYFPHAVVSTILSTLPTSINNNKLFKMHLGIRKKALKKKEREALKLKGEGEKKDQ